LLTRTANADDTDRRLREVRMNVRPALIRTISSTSLILVIPPLLLSCGTREGAPDTGDGTFELDPYADGPLELPEYQGDPFAGFGPVTRLEVPEEPMESGGEEVEEVLLTGAGGDSESDSGETLETGRYSVQIAACETEEGADSMASLVGYQTDEPVFVDAVPPYWKVRVGSFDTHSEAEAFLPTAREMGYGDAWVVERESGSL
jgi:hypothetical protein